MNQAYAQQKEQRLADKEGKLAAYKAGLPAHLPLEVAYRASQQKEVFDNPTFILKLEQGLGLERTPGVH
jgi:hypothetical protein